MSIATLSIEETPAPHFQQSAVVAVDIGGSSGHSIDGSNATVKHATTTTTTTTTTATTTHHGTVKTSTVHAAASVPSPPQQSFSFFHDYVTNSNLGLWVYKGWSECLVYRRAGRLQDELINILGLIPYLCTKFLLEVCGAAGAVWGSTEVYLLRNEQTIEFWRWICYIVFVAFLIRWYWHGKHFLEQERYSFPPIKRHHRRLHRGTFIGIHTVTFILQVLGGCGAFWGSSEVVRLRNSETVERWRIVAAGAGVLFFGRWMYQIFDYCLCINITTINNNNNNNSDNSNPDDAIAAIRASRFAIYYQWFEELVIKLILEVFGAAGAVWGISEIFGFRTNETLDTWRPFAMVVGMIFF